MNYGFKCKKQFFLPVVCQLYSVCYSAEALSTVEFFRVGSKNVSNGHSAKPASNWSQFEGAC